MNVVPSPKWSVALLLYLVLCLIGCSSSGEPPPASAPTKAQLVKAEEQRSPLFGCADLGKTWAHIYATEQMAFFDFLVIDHLLYGGTRNLG